MTDVLAVRGGPDLARRRGKRRPELLLDRSHQRGRGVVGVARDDRERVVTREDVVRLEQLDGASVLGRRFGQFSPARAASRRAALAAARAGPSGSGLSVRRTWTGRMTFIDSGSGSKNQVEIVSDMHCSTG